MLTVCLPILNLTPTKVVTLSVIFTTAYPVAGTVPGPEQVFDISAEQMNK